MHLQMQALCSHPFGCSMQITTDMPKIMHLYGLNLIFWKLHISYFIILNASLVYFPGKIIQDFLSWHLQEDTGTLNDCCYCLNHFLKKKHWEAGSWSRKVATDLFWAHIEILADDV